MKGLNHKGFVRKALGYPIKTQLENLAAEQIEMSFVIGEGCETFRELVDSENTFRHGQGDHLYVMSPKLLVDPMKGSARAKHTNFTHVVDVLVEKGLTVHSLEDSIVYAGSDDLHRMAFKALEPPASNGQGRPKLESRGLTDAHLAAARSIWFDRRYGTNTAALAAMNSPEHRQSTGAVNVGNWNTARAYSKFGKAERRKTIEEAGQS